MWCRGGIDRKRNSTINLTTDSGACYWCLPQTSPLTPDVTTFFSQCSGERQNIFEKLQQYHPAPHTPNGNIHPHIIIHSLFFPPLTLFHFLGNFLTSWTLPFLGHFLFLWDLISLLFSGNLLILSYFNSWVSTPPVDLRTRLPGCVDHQVCSTYVSTPQGQPSGPGPGCYLSLVAPR